jgi:hypothetical protein
MRPALFNVGIGGPCPSPNQSTLLTFMSAPVSERCRQTQAICCPVRRRGEAEIRLRVVLGTRPLQQRRDGAYHHASPTVGLQRSSFHSYIEPHLATDNELVRNILLALLSSLAKVEAQKISDRTKAGMARAKARGSKIGRPRLGAKSARRLPSAPARGRALMQSPKLSASIGTLRRSTQRDGPNLRGTNVEVPPIADIHCIAAKLRSGSQNLTRAPPQSRILCDRSIGAGRQRRALGKGVWLVEATPDRRHSLATNICWSIFESGQCFGNWPVPAHSGLRRLVPVAARPACTCSLGDNPTPVGKPSKLRCALGPIQDLAHGGGKLIGRQRLLNHFHVGVETPLMNNRVARISGHVKHF